MQPRPAGSVAQDGEGRNGLYTAALLNALRQPNLKAEEVFKRVRVDITRKTGRKQVPWESSSLTGEFVFNPGPPKTSIASTGQFPNTELGGAVKNVEISYWESIRGSSNAAVFVSYLQPFPNGAFADLARLRLSELGANAIVSRSARPAQGCPTITGSWKFSVPSLRCESVLVFQPQAGEKLSMQETGCGNTQGIATQDGANFRIDWSMPLCIGHTEIELENSCEHGRES